MERDEGDFRLKKPEKVVKQTVLFVCVCVRVC